MSSSVPEARLVAASPEMRATFELLGEGDGIHWPDADEDLSVAGLLAGAPGAGLRPTPTTLLRVALTEGRPGPMI